MRAPDFWYPDDGRANITATLLTPLGWLYGLATWWRLISSTPRRAPAKVLCVGNLTAGGTGKTPVCLAINDLLTADGTRTAFLTRGYGGKISDPTRIIPGEHGFSEAGDEALLLAGGASTWVSPTRTRGAFAAAQDAAEVIIMDDGFQNPALKKNMSLLVVDGQAGFGNRRMIPAGPLRESIRLGLRRANGIILLGDWRHQRDQDVVEKAGLPVLKARIKVDPRTEPDKARPYIAFSGIGRPQKFFDTLKDHGFTVLEEVPYPDHHAFKDQDIDWLKTLAAERSAGLITTTKDHVRLPDDFKPAVAELPIRVLFDEPDEVTAFLELTLHELGGKR